MFCPVSATLQRRIAFGFRDGYYWRTTVNIGPQHIDSRWAWKNWTVLILQRSQRKDTTIPTKRKIKNTITNARQTRQKFVHFTEFLFFLIFIYHCRSQWAAFWCMCVLFGCGVDDFRNCRVYRRIVLIVLQLSLTYAVFLHSFANSFHYILFVAAAGVRFCITFFAF